MEEESQTGENDGEAFVRYFSIYEGNVRAFVASLLHDWSAVDEVVQTASLVMWRKFDQFDRNGPEKDFLNWAFMIARFEVLKYRSKVARDRLVFSDDVQQLLDTEAETIAATQSERERALQECLKKLQSAQRELIEATYGSGVSIKEAAILRPDRIAFWCDRGSPRAHRNGHHPLLSLGFRYVGAGRGRRERLPRPRRLHQSPPPGRCQSQGGLSRSRGTTVSPHPPHLDHHICRTGTPDV